jgi:shikimate dehydrogenase
VTRPPSRLFVLGHPIAHSLSPRIHGAALASAGIGIRYEALDVDPSTFDETIARLKAEYAGGNVTLPYKERMRDACDVVSDLARHVGAVNTFWTDDTGRLVGDNTDVGGFSYAACELLGTAPRDMSVGVLGAGGAAAAVLAAVEQWPGCMAHVYNRTPERARLLCERFGAFAQPVDDVGVIAGADLVVNATSIGLHDNSLPMDLSLLVRFETSVLDLVYKRPETRFVHALRSRGIRAADGTTMLVRQAALAFEKWFGIAADVAAMYASLPD